jgi:hypothetical protein
MRHQLPFALLLASSAVACVDNVAGDLDDTHPIEEVEAAIERPLGGYDTADERPLFDEDAAFLAAAIERDRAGRDGTSSDPADRRSRRILVLWGRMDGSRPETRDQRRWALSLRRANSAIAVTREIGLDDADDELRPRELPDRIEVRSRTREQLDGLVVRIDDRGASVADRLELTFTDAQDRPVTRPIDVAELDERPIEIDADRGDRIVVIALRERDHCDHGFVRGRWLALAPTTGVYRGMFVDADGALVGHLRGVWGQRRDGSRVLFGKLIAADGSFRGLVTGTYDRGAFQARWLVSTGDYGVLGGQFVDSPHLRGSGFFGRWAEASCAK